MEPRSRLDVERRRRAHTRTQALPIQLPQLCRAIAAKRRAKSRNHGILQHRGRFAARPARERKPVERVDAAGNRRITA
jgi:hypothetical protein